MGKEIIMISIVIPWLWLVALLAFCDAYRMWNLIMKDKLCRRYHIFTGDDYWNPETSFISIAWEIARMKRALASGEGKELIFNDSRYKEHDWENDKNFLD